MSKKIKKFDLILNNLEKNELKIYSLKLFLPVYSLFEIFVWFKLICVVIEYYKLKGTMSLNWSLSWELEKVFDHEVFSPILRTTIGNKLALEKILNIYIEKYENSSEFYLINGVFINFRILDNPLNLDLYKLNIFSHLLDNLPLKFIYVNKKKLKFNFFLLYLYFYRDLKFILSYEKSLDKFFLLHVNLKNLLKFIFSTKNFISSKFIFFNSDLELI